MHYQINEYKIPFNFRKICKNRNKNRNIKKNRKFTSINYTISAFPNST